MNEDELITKLKSYANFVVSELQKWEKEERIHKILTPVNLDREHPEKVVEYSAAVRVVHRNYWDYLESQTFIRHIHSSPKAKETMNAITEFPPKNQSMGAYLFNFTQAIMDSKIGLVKYKPQTLARNLAASLAGSPITRHLMARIYGIGVKRLIKLGKGAVLRPVLPNDSEWERNGDMSSFSNAGFLGDLYSVIEIKMQTRYLRNFHERFYRIFHLLQLYRPQPIGSSHAICRSASPIDGCRPHSSSLYVGGYVNTNPRYLIDNVGDFTGFVNRFLPKLPADWRYINLEFSNPLNIAYYRYVEALENYQRRERAITFAVMGLEALVLEKGAELTYKFRSRLARLVSYLEFDPRSVYDILGQAYSIRSDFVHGSVSKPKNKEKRIRESEKQKNCLEMALEILRICILIVISNGLSFSKDDFTDYIDKTNIGVTKEGEAKLIEVITKYKIIRYGK